MKLIIEDDEGRKTIVPFVREEITIGRQEGNTIRLTERNVSRRHARLIRQNGHVLVEDLGSYNGIRINGEKIQGQTPVRDGDLIQIGDYDLAIQSEAGAPPPVPPQPAHPPPASERTPPAAASEQESSEEMEDTQPPATTTPKESPAEAMTADSSRHSTSVIRVDEIPMDRPQRPAASIEPEEAPRLVVLNTALAGREFACIRTELRIGRTSENDIALDHRSLSRTHAKLIREDNGEWRVVDLNSANGLMVNGERYAQATLRTGDVLDLGHVKVRFLAAGASFRAEGRRGLGLWLGVGLLVGLVALGATWLISPGFRQLVSPAPAEDTTGPQQDQAPTAESPPSPPEKAANPPPSEEPAVQSVDRAAKLQGARTAFEAQDFDQALGLLESLQGAGGARDGEVEELLAKVRKERAAKKALKQARKELAAGRLDQAKALLEQAQETQSFQQEHQELAAKLEEALQGKPSAPGIGPTDPGSPSPRSEEARQLYEEGYNFLKKKQFKSAQESLTKCLEVDKTFARCHMLLGSTYAKLRDPESGAKHYRQFIKLAPDDPDAARVKSLLEQYERSRRE